MKITFLAPFGANFTHQGYSRLAEIYGAPIATYDNYIPAERNENVLPLLVENGGYGTIAMNTTASCHVPESVSSFAQLLEKCPNNESCPFTILGAHSMDIDFMLMAKKGVTPSKVITKAQSLWACRKNIERLGLQTQETISNGEAARLVAEDRAYAEYAALAPATAAEMFGLEIIQKSFQDKKAVTTFFLLAPKDRVPEPKEKNRALFSFSLHEEDSGALLPVLQSLANHMISMRHIDSVGMGDEKINFVIEVDVPYARLEGFASSMKQIRKYTKDLLCFGPFPVL